MNIPATSAHVIRLTGRVVAIRRTFKKIRNSRLRVIDFADLDSGFTDAQSGFGSSNRLCGCPDFPRHPVGNMTAPAEPVDRGRNPCSGVGESAGIEKYETSFRGTRRFIPAIPGLTGPSAWRTHRHQHCFPWRWQDRSGHGSGHSNRHGRSETGCPFGAISALVRRS